MTVNGYLSRLAMQAIIRDTEKQGIQRSVGALRVRLRRHFGPEIREQVIFGSYSRNTILPRHLDARSDVDYMVVFRDPALRPQTYLDRLRTFASASYARSEIAQSNPTIVLELNHIRFELVPATRQLFSGLQIPAPASVYLDWINTDPTGFNNKLTRSNNENHSFIKRLVRLVKFWNACNGYVFDSYELEQKIVDHGYWNLGALFSFRPPRLEDYFFLFMSSLTVEWGAAQWKLDKVERARRMVDEIQELQRQGFEQRAETKIRQLLPPAGGLLTGRLA
jgi:predicted nucleotidyltransferase